MTAETTKSLSLPTHEIHEEKLQDWNVKKHISSHELIQMEDDYAAHKYFPFNLTLYLYNIAILLYQLYSNVPLVFTFGILKERSTTTSSVPILLSTKATAILKSFKLSSNKLLNSP